MTGRSMLPTNMTKERLSTELSSRSRTGYLMPPRRSPVYGVSMKLTMRFQNRPRGAFTARTPSVSRLSMQDVSVRCCTPGKISEACAVEPPDLCDSFPRCVAKSGHREDSRWDVWDDLRKPSRFAARFPGTRGRSSRQCPGSLHPRDSQPQSRDQNHVTLQQLVAGVVCTPEPSTSSSRAIGRVRTCLPHFFAIRGDRGGDGYIVARASDKAASQIPWVDMLAEH